MLVTCGKSCLASVAGPKERWICMVRDSKIEEGGVGSEASQEYLSHSRQPPQGTSKESHVFQKRKTTLCTEENRPHCSTWPRTKF